MPRRLLPWLAPMVAVAVVRAATARADASTPSPPVASDASSEAPAIRPHVHTLAECLALADRNFPNLWAARARLALARAQLQEAIWTPWFQWSAQSAFGLSPPGGSTVLYPQGVTLAARNITGIVKLEPFFSLGISGFLPLYAFGKIEHARHAGEAAVRVSEWDMEKARQQMRMDVRRAFYGLQLARGAKDIVVEAIAHVDDGIRSVREKIAKGDTAVGDVDRLRLEAFKDEIASQGLQAAKGEGYALAALRFMTGVQSAFDVADEPLKRPERPLLAEAQYLEAARVLRPEINMARADVAARSAAVKYNRAKLFPDVGLGLGADFASTLSTIPQQNLWASDGFNHFYYYIGVSIRWSLDALPQAARTQQAESKLEEGRSLERLSMGSTMQEVEKAWADATEARTREQAWDRAEHLAKQWISIAQDNIDLGTWDERALLEPIRAYGNARVQHLYALMDVNVTQSNLALVSGWDSAAP